MDDAGGDCVSAHLNAALHRLLNTLHQDLLPTGRMVMLSYWNVAVFYEIFKSGNKKKILSVSLIKMLGMERRK